MLALAVLGGLAGAFSRSADAQLTIPGVESVTALETLQERFPGGGAGGASARIVFAAPDGGTVTDPANAAAIKRSLAQAADAHQVVAVSDPFQAQGVSPDGSIAYATVGYDVQVDQITEVARAQLLAVAEDAESAGLQVEFGG